MGKKKRKYKQAFTNRLSPETRAIVLKLGKKLRPKEWKDKKPLLFSSLPAFVRDGIDALIIQESDALMDGQCFIYHFAGYKICLRFREPRGDRRVYPVSPSQFYIVPFKYIREVFYHNNIDYSMEDL